MRELISQCRFPCQVRSFESLHEGTDIGTVIGWVAIEVWIPTWGNWLRTRRIKTTRITFESLHEGTDPAGCVEPFRVLFWIPTWGNWWRKMAKIATFSTSCLYRFLYRIDSPAYCRMSCAPDEQRTDMPGYATWRCSCRSTERVFRLLSRRSRSNTWPIRDNA